MDTYERVLAHVCDDGPTQVDVISDGFHELLIIVEPMAMPEAFEQGAKEATTVPSDWDHLVRRSLTP